MCLRNRYFIGLVQLLVLTSHVVVRQSDASKRYNDDDESLLVETTAGESIIYMRYTHLKTQILITWDFTS